MSVSNALTLPESLTRSLASAAYLGGVGAITAGLLTTLNPLIGAVYTIISATGASITHIICQQFSCQTSSKTAQFALDWIGGIGLGVLATSLMGYPLSLKVAAIMTLGAFATSLSIDWISNHIKTN
jgi:hypothetical protein